MKPITAFEKFAGCPASISSTGSQSMNIRTFVGTMPQMRAEIQKMTMMKRKETIKYLTFGGGVLLNNSLGSPDLRSLGSPDLRTGGCKPYTKTPTSIRSVRVPNPAAIAQMNVATFLDFQILVSEMHFLRLL